MCYVETRRAFEEVSPTRTTGGVFVRGPFKRFFLRRVLEKRRVLSKREFFFKGYFFVKRLFF